MPRGIARAGSPGASSAEKTMMPPLQSRQISRLPFSDCAVVITLEPQEQEAVPVLVAVLLRITGDSPGAGFTGGALVRSLLQATDALVEEDSPGDRVEKVPARPASCPCGADDLSAACSQAAPGGDVTEHLGQQLKLALRRFEHELVLTYSNSKNAKAYEFRRRVRHIRSSSKAACRKPMPPTSAFTSTNWKLPSLRPPPPGRWALDWCAACSDSASCWRSGRTGLDQTAGSPPPARLRPRAPRSEHELPPAAVARASRSAPARQLLELGSPRAQRSG
eukprot:scaffold1411_cov252-Pinguiococcus_pyrenoidosus.AAC.15